MIIGVFCRRDHPPGYGKYSGHFYAAPAEVFQENTDDEGYWCGAHGYVTLLVNCEDHNELQRVQDAVSTYWQWPERNDVWYSGPFDLVGALHGVDVIAEILWSANLATIVDRPQYRSLGDNRAVAFLNAKDIV